MEAPEQLLGKLSQRARLEERLQSLPDDWEIACLAGTDLLGHNPETAAW